MTYKEFIDCLEVGGISLSNRTPDESWKDNSVPYKYIFEEVETGGYSGGSCWNDSNTQPYSSGESLGRFSELSKAVRCVSPNITFLDYEGVLDLVKKDSRTEYEYYGNSTDYSYQYIILDELYEYLKGLDVWKN